MKLQNLRANLIQTITGKEIMLDTINKSQLRLPTDRVKQPSELVILTTMQQMLEINVDELKRILTDVELIINEKS